MHSPTIPFRLVSTQREEQLAQFNARKEIAWFGFRGAFEEPGLAIINFTKIESGLQGGGGTSAINGGVIAAGFDAAFVLAGLGHYDSKVVVTLELSVKFLSLACRVPCDYLPRRSWPLFKARAVLRGLLASNDLESTS